jgi:hypothetical protein
MKQLFNASERFSKSLDEVRGPEREKRYLSRGQAWAKASSARRAAEKSIGYGGVSLIVGAISFALYKKRSQIANTIFKTKNSAERLKKVS